MMYCIGLYQPMAYSSRNLGTTHCDWFSAYQNVSARLQYGCSTTIPRDSVRRATCVFDFPSTLRRSGGYRTRYCAPSRLVLRLNLPRRR
jgi:hypothetical protein